MRTMKYKKKNQQIFIFILNEHFSRDIQHCFMQCNDSPSFTLKNTIFFGIKTHTIYIYPETVFKSTISALYYT